MFTDGASEIKDEFTRYEGQSDISNLKKSLVGEHLNGSERLKSFETIIDCSEE